MNRVFRGEEQQVEKKRITSRLCTLMQPGALQVTSLGMVYLVLVKGLVTDWGEEKPSARKVT